MVYCERVKWHHITWYRCTLFCHAVLLQRNSRIVRSLECDKILAKEYMGNKIKYRTNWKISIRWISLLNKIQKSRFTIKYCVVIFLFLLFILSTIPHKHYHEVVDFDITWITDELQSNHMLSNFLCYIGSSLYRLLNPSTVCTEIGIELFDVWYVLPYCAAHM